LDYLKKINWFSYIERNKHEDLLLDMIEYEFGSDITIIMGDWSCNKQKVKHVTTPNKRLLRKLNNRFKVLMIDEYKTSKIHYKHNVECEKLTVLDDNQKTKEIHAVLLYKNNENGIGGQIRESGCINRDRNSVLNMERIVKNYLENGKLLPIFARQSESPKERNLRGNTTSDAKGAVENVMKVYQTTMKQKVIKPKN